MFARPLTINDFEYIVANLPTESAKVCLRQIREVECFSIINRGEAWYRRLTEQQKVELDSWYLNWLSITDTFIKPVKPYWIK